MKIYTRTGDKGSTQIYADKAVRVDKDDLVVQSYGDMDELNSHIGLLAAHVTNKHKPMLQDIQRNLFQAGFAISASSTLTKTDIENLESLIDNITRQMPPNKSFVLPGGCKAAAQAHVCRAVCRRAERAVISLSKHYDVPEVVHAYLNRLSDFLFTFARFMNVEAGVEEVPV
ncbi:cobalamin adenosyltransferase [Alteromonas macleodii]|uniref:cob(I)yrinic acid a,c-diamide adenosyltransferase n=1 Tax=Alteromonas macleodii TaxID=28108 RepID=UPI00057CFF1A|nr:cob(I)yrinic acid a,c-diamide adenosyltransferase [Alteromonas macleodii]KHT53008.1 cobalamin adenosyltransferase [Alteromonas macleodii]